MVNTKFDRWIDALTMSNEYTYIKGEREYSYEKNCIVIQYSFLSFKCTS